MVLTKPIYPYNCTYDCTYKALQCPHMAISTAISTVKNWFICTMNLQGRDSGFGFLILVTIFLLRNLFRLLETYFTTSSSSPKP